MWKYSKRCKYKENQKIKKLVSTPGLVAPVIASTGTAKLPKQKAPHTNHSWYRP
jgi:hypothetical protein